VPYAVKFEDVVKRYPRGGRPRYASVRHDLIAGLQRVGQRVRGRRLEERGPVALDQVSFRVEEGESFAIIGPNGAGKSTALKIVARISYPTHGVVRVRGRVGALIEVGSGVHPELTGEENIWLHGRIMGMSRVDVRRHYDEIVEFAEVQHALQTPLKMYSSGMQLRLGFAIASHLDPDIFVVDEALAVGDAGFQAKCVERMTKLVSEGRTLLFVSHTLSAIEAVCTRGIFINGGRVQFEGSARETIRSYLGWVDETHQRRLGREWVSYDSRFLSLVRFSCHGDDGIERFAFRTGEPLSMVLDFRAVEALTRPYVSIGITDGRPGNLILCSMLVDGDAPERVEDFFKVTCRLHTVPLLPRVYEVWASVRSEQAYGDLYDWQRVGAFRIAESSDMSGPSAVSYVATDGPIHAAHSWAVDQYS
jgi:lipopolysaccharide transport system ATP-binding protein